MQDPQDIIADTLRDAPGIDALFLSGSHGTGHADAHSDLDFLLVSEAGASDEIAALWRGAVERIGEIVLWWDRTTRPALINAITADWTRIDLVVLKPGQLGAQRQDALKVLFDHRGIFDGLPPETGIAPPMPTRVLYQIEEFIRILGLLPLAVGRREYLNGAAGVFHLRNLLIELMIAENGVRHRGGALHLNRLLDADQQRILAALPFPAPNEQSMVAAHMAQAAVFLPRARRLARQWGVDWPERFEEVTWARLGETLSLTRPYGPQGETD